jgi:Ca-activated chloride channel family protein
MNQSIYKSLLFGFFSIAATTSWSQSNHENLREGDKSYYQQEYLKAEENYRKALEKDAASVSGNHNLGNALYNQERYDEASKYFESAALQANDKAKKAMSFHNLGNSYLSQLSGVGNPEQAQELLNQSIDAYKQSLKLNPKDEATKYNLAYAQKMQQEIAKQPQQQPQQPNQGNSLPQDNQPQDDDNQDKQPPKEEPKPEQPKQKPNDNMTKEEAERLIKIMEEEERKVQERMNKKGQKGNPSGKDW